MKPIVVLLLCLIACEDPAPSPPPPPELARWLEDWERMRSCLVGNRGGVADLATALKIAQLRGSRCAPPRSSLVANLEPELAALWRQLTGQPPAIVAPRELLVRILAEELACRATRPPA